MINVHKNKDGFTVVETLLVVIVLVVIGVAGYFVVKRVHKTSPSTSSSSSTNNTAYSGWKAYCDSGTKFCFKYPSNWKLTGESNSSVGTIQTLENPSRTFDLQYGDLPVADGEPTSVDTSDPLSPSTASPNITFTLGNASTFYVSSVNNLSSNNSKYKVVSGYFVSAAENVPTIAVMESNTVSSLGLKAGQQTTLASTALNLENSLKPTNIIVMAGGPISASPYSASTAQAWLKSADGLADQKVVESFYVEAGQSV